MQGGAMEQVEFMEQVMDDAMEVHVDKALGKTEDLVWSRKNCNTPDSKDIWMKWVRWQVCCNEDDDGVPVHDDDDDGWLPVLVKL